MGLCPRCHTLQPDTITVCGRCGMRAVAPSASALPVAPHHGYAPPRMAYPPYPWRPPNAPHELSPRALAATAMGGPPLARTLNLGPLAGRPPQAPPRAQAPPAPPPAAPAPAPTPPRSAPPPRKSRAPLAFGVAGGAIAGAALAAVAVYAWSTRPAHREALAPSDEDRVVTYETLKDPKFIEAVQQRLPDLPCLCDERLAAPAVA